MKVVLTAVLSLFLSCVSFSQTKGQQYIESIKDNVENNFWGSWQTFRWRYCPLLPFERTHWSEFDLKTPDLIPDSIKAKGGIFYTLDFKLTELNPYHVFPKFFILEKTDGFKLIKHNIYNRLERDSITYNIYDSLFPYDNRFLVCLYDSTGNNLGFFGGNVLWDSWYKTGRTLDAANVGWMRGVQFGVQDVMYYYVPRDTAEINEIKRLRPQFPNYDYAWAKKSFFTQSSLLIGAPKGKEDDLVEFIWYTNNPKKTGDTSYRNSLYEMRYILPTAIKSIKERRLEKRKLEGDEYKQILGSKVMRKFIDFYWND